MSKSTTEQIRIEKNIPMPSATRIPPLPFENMEVGDSFKLELTHPADDNTIRQRIWRLKKKFPAMRFSMIKVEDNVVRIFRTE